MFLYTVGFLIHGRHARILAWVFGVRSEDRGGAGVGSSGGPEIQFCRFYRDVEIQFYSSKGRKNTVLQFYQDHVLKIPCIKDHMY